MKRIAGLWNPAVWTSAVVWIAVLVFSVAAEAQEASWIWSPEHAKDDVPRTACHFRKEFTVPAPQSAEIKIAADDRYELYLNGRVVGSGGEAQEMDRFDVSHFVRSGPNVLAVKVTNTTGSTAALAVMLVIKDRTHGPVRFGTDTTWVTQLRPLPLWHTPLYNASRWAAAQSFGPLGKTSPWDRVTASEESRVAAAAPTETNPASPPPTVSPDAPRKTESPDKPAKPAEDEFVVEQVLDHTSTGSLLALTFNEFGHVIASRDKGELLLIHDSNKDGIVDDVRVCCDKVKSCQGILCLNGEVFVTGEGPDGTGLYRLTDTDRDGQLEQVRLLVKFEGSGGEYGPHGIALGTDGLLYVVAGNRAAPSSAGDRSSPYRDSYEGDLNTPRYTEPEQGTEDSRAPGGVILRVNLEGEKVQVIAGGLRNAYDLAFDRQGDLFTHDGDAEADLGTPWYRPASVYHVVPGAEFGWRSGWAKWPDYFVDRLPPMLDTRRGAPTGMVFYNHHAFPEEYYDALFVADWLHGRISALKLKQNGSSFTASSELFVDDPSLHVTDLTVGPDGCVYFVTGGREMPGGLFRIRWTGKVPSSVTDIGTGLTAVIRHPQLDSAWARQKLANLKVALGAEWDRAIPGVALSAANPWQYRTQALDLMQLFGPKPTTGLLVRLAEAKNEQVRAKAAELMGLHANAETLDALIGLLDDTDRGVRRKACEALVRAGQTAPVEKLTALLQSDDRHEAWAARRLLERVPAHEWRDKLVQSSDHRLVIQSSLALLTASPGKDNALLVLRRLSGLMTEFITDRDFIDMLRVMQVAIGRGELKPADVSELKPLLADEFPSSDRLINRELVRLLVYLQESAVLGRCLEHLNSDSVPAVEKLQLALHLRYLQEGWSTDQKVQVLEYLESARRHHEDKQMAGYVTQASQDFAEKLTAEEARTALTGNARWPHATLALLRRMPEHLDSASLTSLTRLDEELLSKNDLQSRQLKVGIAAVLARSGDAESLAHLRSLWDRDPERRPALALGLAQWPTEENWSYLVRSLSVVEASAAQEMLAKLRTVDLAPEESDHYRLVILRGLELGDHGAADAVALLDHWVGESAASEADWRVRLQAWQKRYSETWPDALSAELPTEHPGSKHTYADLVRFLNSDHAVADSAEHGGEVFVNAGCANCHRCGSRGTDNGPDLTMLGQRLMKKEIVQSLIFPSHVIAEPYLRQTIVTNRGRIYAGRVSPSPEPGKVVLEQENGLWITLSEGDIEETRTQKISPMPTGLLDGLSEQEVADLLAHMLSQHEPLVAQQPEEKAIE